MAKIDIYNLKDIPRSEIPKEGQKAYDLYMLTIEHFGQPQEWADDQEVTSRISLVFKLIDYLNKKAKTETKKTTKTKITTKRKKTKQKTEEPDEQKPKKTAKRKSAKRTTKRKTATRRRAKKKDTAKAVEHVDPQISIIRSFYLMLDKPVPRRRILTLYKRIERFATERIIRKKDKYATEIEDISHILAQAYNKGKDPITISVADEDKQKLKEIAYSQKVRESVRIVKSFLAFLTNQDLAKAEKLLERIDKAFEKDKISKSDPYYEKVKKIEKLLDNYVSNEKQIKLSESQLNGLLGINAKQLTLNL